jgi:hypothetical protein
MLHIREKLQRLVMGKVEDIRESRDDEVPFGEEFRRECEVKTSMIRSRCSLGRHVPYPRQVVQVSFVPAVC